MALGDKSYGLTGGVGFLAQPSVNQNVNTTTSIINLNTVNWTSGHFSSSRFTVPVDGWYEVKYRIRMATGVPNLSTFKLRKNGTDFYTSGSSTGDSGQHVFEVPSVNTDYWELFITTVILETISSVPYVSYFGMRKFA